MKRVGSIFLAVIVAVLVTGCSDTGGGLTGDVGNYRIETVAQTTSVVTFWDRFLTKAYADAGYPQKYAEFNTSGKVTNVYTKDTNVQIHWNRYEYLYNTDGRLERWNHYESPDGVVEPTLASYKLYTYDLVGNVTQIDCWSFSNFNYMGTQNPQWYKDSYYEITSVSGQTSLIVQYSQGTQVNVEGKLEPNGVFTEYKRETRIFSNGAMTQKTIIQGSTTVITFENDADGNVTKMTYPTSVTDYTYDIQQGVKVLKSEQTNNNLTEYSYVLEEGIEEKIGTAINWVEGFKTIGNPFNMK